MHSKRRYQSDNLLDRKTHSELWSTTVRDWYLDIALQTSLHRVTPELLGSLRRRVAVSPALQQCQPRFGSTDPAGDLGSLEECFETGDASRDEYARYCFEHESDPHSDTAACEFMADLWGHLVILFSLPRDSDTAAPAFAAIRQLAGEFSLEVYNSEDDRVIPESYQGTLPPGY